MTLDHPNIPNAFIPKMEILPLAQQRLWQHLKPARSLRLVLYGGTAIALQLGHRTSIDFDFFSDQPLDRSQLSKVFSFFNNSTMLQDQPNCITLLVRSQNSEDTVKVSFFGGLDFGRVENPLNTDDGMLQVASLDDLMAHKLKVILQRSEAKDYLDIAAMIQAGVSLEKGLSSAQTLYGPTFQPSESLKACVYFNDGDLASLSKSTKDLLVRAVAKVQNLPSIPIASRYLYLE
jgi:hypothetical protein